MGLNADIAAMMEADIGSATDDWSEDLLHIASGQTIAGTFSAVGKTEDVDADGILTTHDAEHVSKRSAWATLPANRDTVAVSAVKYYIASHDIDEAGVSLKLRVN